MRNDQINKLNKIKDIGKIIQKIMPNTPITMLTENVDRLFWKNTLMSKKIALINIKFDKKAMALFNAYQKVISTSEVAKYLEIESERNSDMGINKKKIIIY